MSKDESKEIDRLLEIVSTLSSLGTKLESVKENITNEISSVKNACDVCRKNIQEDITCLKEKFEKLENRQDNIEKKQIKQDLEFDKWKLRLGVIAPVLTLIITTAVIAALEHFFGSIF